MCYRVTLFSPFVVEYQKKEKMRATQLLHFINVEIIPGLEEIRQFYTHLNVTMSLKYLRKQYRRDLTKINNESLQELETA